MRLRFERGRRDDLETLHPAYFALVMATGIVGIATHLHSLPVVPTALFWLNALFIVVLTAATVVRILRYPHAFVADIRSHSRGVGFFTTVAAAGVFGSQLVIQWSAPREVVLPEVWFLAMRRTLNGKEAAHCGRDRQQAAAG